MNISSRTQEQAEPQLANFVNRQQKSVEHRPSAPPFFTATKYFRQSRGIVGTVIDVAKHNLLLPRCMYWLQTRVEANE